MFGPKKWDYNEVVIIKQGSLKGEFHSCLKPDMAPGHFSGFTNVILQVQADQTAYFGPPFNPGVRPLHSTKKVYSLFKDINL